MAAAAHRSLLPLARLKDDQPAGAGTATLQMGVGMIGAIAGDIIGSIYEVRPIKVTTFPLFRWECTFTDDTVLTVAVADALLSGVGYAEKLLEYFQAYPSRGFGWKFRKWAQSRDLRPYGSWGNGSAMRVSPVGWAFDSLEEVLEQAERSAAVTHDHPTAIAGAQATAAAVFLARTGATKDEIRTYVEREFGYDLSESLDSVRKWYRFDPSCQGTVPYAIRAFLESEIYEEAVWNAVALGGDSDTLACITGGIAGACFGVPEEIRAEALTYLDDPLREVMRCFEERWCERN